MSYIDLILKKLSRVTSSGKFIAEIDGLRFIAIMPVVIVHLQNHLIVKPVVQYTIDPTKDIIGRLVAYGHYGVQLFFVISGFVLAMPFALHYMRHKSPVSLSSYFLRRLTRLEPPYIISMIICYILLILFKGEHAIALLPYLAASIGYVHNIIYAKQSLINLVAWSLEVEIQFYLLVPLLAKLFAINSKVLRRTTITLIGLSFLIFQLIFINQDGRLALSILNYLQYFLMGFLLADIYINEWQASPQQNWQWDIVALSGWIVFIIMCEFEAVARIFFPPLILLLFISVFRGPLFNRVFTNRWITTIGGMCYTIYLIHSQIISFMEKLLPRIAFTSYFSINLIVHFLVLLPFLAFFCAIFFLFIEKPCMNKDWPIRFWRRARGLLLQEA